MKKPELLSPIADFTSCLAAVHNGADAVYVGVPGWNARGRTPDLSADELVRILDFCHLRGVRVYFAMNVLVFERELRALSAYIRDLISLGPDAFIVQDPGLARLIKHHAPHQEIHASTQMTLSSAASVRLAADLGIRRAVLARELALEEIRAIRTQTPIELEVFVHGALCVSYSGQCLTSENFGGRSANRGQCAQSCRLPYRLRVDGRDFAVADKPYLFSPQDLCALDWIPRLAEIGVDSLKIEGRLKSPEYIGAVTRAYRAALDQKPIDDESRAQLESLFSRGLFSGWLNGVDHQRLVSGTYSDHQGVLLGTIAEIRGHAILVRRASNQAFPLYPGDGLLCVPATPNRPEIGGRLYASKNQENMLLLELANDFPYEHLRPGDAVWRNDSPALEKSIRKSWTNRSRWRTIPIHMRLYGEIGKPMILTIDDCQGHQVHAQSAVSLEKSRSTADLSWIPDELNALSGTAYRAVSVKCTIPENAFVQRKWIRSLRQEAVALMDQARLGDYAAAVVIREAPPAFPQARPSPNEPPLLNLLIRRADQLDQLPRGLALDTIFLDFDYGRPLLPSLQKIRDLGYRCGIATLRIHKDGEQKALRASVDARPHALLIRHPGTLASLRAMRASEDIELVGDHSLNICNSLAAQWYLSAGLKRVHPGWDLNRDQILDLVSAFGGQVFEIGLHQYVPTFHMEHCVFAHMLSSGSRYPDCKVACLRHQVEVVDHKGERHFLQSDAECRNTLYLGKPQSALRLLKDLLNAQVRRFRIDVLNESAADTARKAELYSAVLRGQLSVEEAFSRIGALEKYGITEGQLFNRTRWRDRKKQARETH